MCSSGRGKDSGVDAERCSHTLACTSDVARATLSIARDASAASPRSTNPLIYAGVFVGLSLPPPSGKETPPLDCKNHSDVSRGHLVSNSSKPVHTTFQSLMQRSTPMTMQAQLWCPKKQPFDFAEANKEGRHHQLRPPNYSCRPLCSPLHVPLPVSDSVFLKGSIWSLQHIGAAQEAISIWEGSAVMTAFGTLLLLSVLKIVMGSVWIMPPVDIMAIIVGVLGMESAVIYTVCRICLRSSADSFDEGVFPVEYRMLVAQMLSMISLPPSIILNGVLFVGLLRENTAVNNMPTAVMCIIQSIAQSAVFMFINIKATKARSLLQIAAECKAMTKPTPEESSTFEQNMKV